MVLLQLGARARAEGDRAAASAAYLRIGELIWQAPRGGDQLLEQVGRMTAVLDKNELTEFDPIIDIPPPLEGVVVKVGGNNLVEISVGADDGIRKGHKLDVSRGARYSGNPSRRGGQIRNRTGPIRSA